MAYTQQTWSAVSGGGVSNLTATRMGVLETGVYDAHVTADSASSVANAAQPKIITGTVATASATAAKTVTLDSPWNAYTPVAGDMICLTYTNGTSVNTATVAINGGGAISVRSPGGTNDKTYHSVEAGAGLIYRYDGTYLRTLWHLTASGISDANIINPAHGTYSFIQGAQAAYLKRKAISSAVTSSTSPALSLDSGDWSTIAVGHNITAITFTGTGGNLQTVNLKLTGTGSYNLAFGTDWNFGFGVSAPAAITNGKSHYIFGRWNTTSAKVDVLDVKSEA